jgi:DNA modification methylase
MITVKQCDNLELMNSIPDNHIDLIYCDILYGTGRNFDDYKDLKASRKNIEEHYIPRIKEMYRILKNSGSIYLQMDTKINHWMRIILDDIFGYENFRNEIVWCYKTIGLGKTYLSKHDVILYYSKSDNITFNKIHHAPSDSTIDKWQNVVNDLGEIPYDKLTPYCKKMYKKENYEKNPINIYRGSILLDWWSDINTVSRGGNKEVLNGKYSTQKPKELLYRIIKVSSNENDLVADFYLGSGTTAVVCKELNRNFIGCDISKKAIDITNKRIQDEYEKTSLFNEPLGGVTNTIKYLDVA